MRREPALYFLNFSSHLNQWVHARLLIISAAAFSEPSTFAWHSLGILITCDLHFQPISACAWIYLVYADTLPLIFFFFPSLGGGGEGGDYADNKIISHIFLHEPNGIPFNVV